MRLCDVYHPLDTRAAPFDRIIEWLLISLLAFMPLAFGAVEAWSEEVVIATAAAISICFLARTVALKGALAQWTWSYVPVAAFVALIAIQLIPLPGWLVRLVSPHTFAEKTRLLDALGHNPASGARMALSFYPFATWHDLRLVLAVASVFVVVFNVYRRPEQILRLLYAIAIIGGGVAAIALAQDLVGNGKIYGFVPVPREPALGGPFVNHSHYAQFMNLSIGAGLAAVFVLIRRKFAGGAVEPSAVAEYLSSPEARRVWALLAVVVIGAATIFMSLSRGGMISLLLAGTFTTLLLSSRGPIKGPGWIMVLLALAAFICVLYVGFDAVYDRLGTLSDLRRAEGGRWQMVRDVAVAWTRFPLVGAGLGTHEVVYPMFDRSDVIPLASHAENEYAQAAEETGAIGLLALTAFGVCVWLGYARAIRSSSRPIHLAAYGLGFGLVAIQLHSLSDFGQHVPANAFLSAVFGALLVRLPHIAREKSPATEHLPTGRWRTRIAALGLGGAALVWGVALLDADAARRGESYSKQAFRAERTLVDKEWQGSHDEYAYIIGCADKARNNQPGNIVYHHWLSVYRWRAISQQTDPTTGQVILTPQAIEFAERIASEQRAALRLCPVYGPTWCVLGQLERFILEQREVGARHIRIGRQLAPCDPTACFIAGLLSADEGDAEEAFHQWQRAVKLDGTFFASACSALVRELKRPDLALELAGEDVHHLVDLERALEELEASSHLVATVTVRIIAILEQECQKQGAAAWKLAWLAERYRQEGNTKDAIAMYRRALAADYGQVWWRYCLAELYAERGRLTDAVRELRVCVRLRPHDSAARQFLKRLLPQINAREPGSAQ